MLAPCPTKERRIMSGIKALAEHPNILIGTVSGALIDKPGGNLILLPAVPSNCYDIDLDHLGRQMAAAIRALACRPDAPAPATCAMHDIGTASVGTLQIVS